MVFVKESQIEQGEQNINGAKFNAGIAQLERINKIKIAMGHSKVSNDFVSWHKMLNMLLDELWQFCSKTERAEIEILENSARMALYNNPGVNVDIWLKSDTLHKYERYLIDIEARYGLSMPSMVGGGAAANG